MSMISAGRALRRVAVDLCHVSLPIAAVVLAGLFLSACEDDEEGRKETAAPTVNFIYVTGSTDTTIDAFIQDQETGALAEVPGAPFVGISSNRDLIAHPSATTLFVDQSGGGKVLIKAMDPASGHLSNVSEGTFAVAGAASAYVALTPDGSRLYGTDDATLTLNGYAFDEDQRDLSSLSWSPFSLSGVSPNVAAMDGTGSYFYIASSPNFFHSYALDPSTGQPSTIGSPLSTAFTSVFKLIADPLGEYMFAYSGGSNEVISLAIQTDGSLAVASSVGVGTFVNGLSVSPDGQWVYAAAGISGLFVYQFNRADGSFTAVPGSPYHAAYMPNYAAATPDGKYLYVAEQTAPVLAGFEIQSDGSLVKLDQSDGELHVSTAEFVLIVTPPAAE